MRSICISIFTFKSFVRHGPVASFSRAIRATQFLEIVNKMGGPDALSARRAMTNFKNHTLNAETAAMPAKFAPEIRNAFRASIPPSA
jgi:hypothetical protein